MEKGWTMAYVLGIDDDWAAGVGWTIRIDLTSWMIGLSANIISSYTFLLFLVLFILGNFIS